MPYAIADDMVAAIKRDSYLAAVQNNFSTQQILSIVDELIVKSVAPLLVSLTQGFYRSTFDVALVVGQSSYVIPQFALMNDFEQILCVDSTNGSYYDLTRIETSELKTLKVSATQTGTPQYFYMDSNKFNVFPAPDAVNVSGRIFRFFYYRRPAHLTSITNCAVVTPGALTSTQFTLNYPAVVPLYGSYQSYDAVTNAAAWFTGPFNLYAGAEPYELVAAQVVATANIAARAQTFALSSFQETTPPFMLLCPNANNSAANSGPTGSAQTCFVNVPPDLTPHVKDLAINHIAMVQGATQQLQDRQGTILDNMAAVMKTVGNRGKNQPKKLSLIGNPMVRGFSSGGPWPRST